MASTGKCIYCGSVISSNERSCPNCGAPNEGFVVDTGQHIIIPGTIEELKEYCAGKNMPLLRMRFFIGEDQKAPKAYGIYRDGNDFVVYNNKPDGHRSIHYQGPDEARAVNELYRKLMARYRLWKIYSDVRIQEKSSDSIQEKTSESVKRETSESMEPLTKMSTDTIASIVILVIFILFLMAASSSEDMQSPGGYYYTDRGPVHYHYDHYRDDPGSGSWNSWYGEDDWGSDW